MTTPLPASALNRVKENVSDFIAVESELAKAELVPAAKHAGIGTGLFAGASAFIFHAVWMLIIAVAIAISWALNSFTPLDPWGAFTFGFLITVVMSLLIAFILIMLGRAQLRQVKKPEATIAEAKATLDSISEALGAKPDAEPVQQVYSHRPVAE
ncbi:MAG: hypothetical protein CSA64_03970 [Arachnia propionica]|nr:MAG: hypothetical protein CSA64_03970 [Arachnia propionica]